MTSGPKSTEILEHDIDDLLSCTEDEEEEMDDEENQQEEEGEQDG